jgi:hypothetical protein
VVQKTSIIVDGIDACEERERKKLLQFFTSTIDQSNIESANLRCLFISQELADIKEALPMACVLRLKEPHSKLDIREYTNYHSKRIQRKFELSEAAREDIVRLVFERDDLTFLLIRNDLRNLYYQDTLEGLFNGLGLDKPFVGINSRLPTCVYTPSPPSKSKLIAIGMLGDTRF